ncbi:hypothetical protein RvY_01559 [Ramazzottius varieornatus]|uniref:ADP-ribosylation factor-related protein 1 n=1 Tax=Ramazzottius varieornatus TaxID=947166 RepID=A0A1D1URH5_RAMVA|nr:hypothetical protein RvY_01559 [Ramazzottius varieornatus]
MGILDKIANALGSGPKTFNVLVVGLDNSGKSTILNSLKTENKSSPESIPPTVGAQIEKIKIGNVVLHFNDLSGQGRYRPMWERCLNDSQAIIFVIDSTDR